MSPGPGRAPGLLLHFAAPATRHPHPVDTGLSRKGPRHDGGSLRRAIATGHPVRTHRAGSM